MEPATIMAMLQAAGTLAQQRKQHEDEKFKLTQQGLATEAGGVEKTASGTQNAMDKLMDVYRTAFVR